ncbi:hypothetical protein TNCV_2835481 [Trichonephila clavipes]|uniref:Uncharacterized protein n=1 Tax=Trichonephila clavipes TaxID=2585209 RepID=A0A8X6RTB0_TRICX|nr:hypothetical protein TNCV_2835481 [Trichonephila clavipes]
MDSVDFCIMKIHQKWDSVEPLNLASRCLRQTSRREDRHIIKSARSLQTASSAAIQDQVAPSLRAPVSSRTIRRRLAPITFAALDASVWSVAVHEETGLF